MAWSLNAMTGAILLLQIVRRSIPRLAKLVYCISGLPSDRFALIYPISFYCHPFNLLLCYARFSNNSELQACFLFFDTLKISSVAAKIVSLFLYFKEYHSLSGIDFLGVTTVKYQYFLCQETEFLSAGRRMLV